MGLADYKPQTRVIPLTGHPFEVKGLSLEDFTKLVNHHLPDMEAVFELGSQVLDGKAEVGMDDLTKLAIAFAEQAPGFVANVIALAAGETEEAAIAAVRTFPFPIQVQAMVDIAELTFDEVGGIKKAMGSVAGLLKKTKLDRPKTQATQP